MNNPSNPQHLNFGPEGENPNEAPNDTVTSESPHVEAEPISLTPVSSDQRRTSKDNGSRRSSDSITGTLTLCMFIAILVMGYFLHNRLSVLESLNTGMADSVLIIDYQSLFAGLPEDVTGEQANEIFNRVHERILALQDAGYIVLDANAVLAAPPELRIDGSLLLEGEL